MLNSLRTRHRVPLQHIRHALDEIVQRTGVAHPLVEQRLLVDGRSLIFEHFGRIIGAGTGGQALFEQARPLLQRVQWNAQELECLFPVATTEPEADLRRIVIHPKVAFGRPTIASNGVPVDVFAPRWAAGESIQQLAQEFACTIDEVQDAMRFQFGSGLVA